MKPLVLVASFGSITSSEIIEGIIRTQEHKRVEETTIGSQSYSAYSYDIKTKYYENTIALVPVEPDAIASVSPLTKAAEVLIVFFDPQSRTIMDKMSQLCNLMKASDIDMGLLLTTKLFEDPSQGLTFEEVKKECVFEFDILELHNNNDQNDEDVEHTGHSILSFNELIEALQNHVWSNIECPNSQSNATAECNPDLLEHQLESFEALVTKFQEFKRVSSTLEREEVYNQAEQLAELFAKIINDD